MEEPYLSVATRPETVKRKVVMLSDAMAKFWQCERLENSTYLCLNLHFDENTEARILTVQKRMKRPGEVRRFRQIQDVPSGCSDYNAPEQ
jgi:hypothetical protein